MEILIWFGVLITLAGLVGLVWTMVLVARARREETEDAALKARIQKIIPLNMGALFVSALGLMCVALGVILS